MSFRTQAMRFLSLVPPTLGLFLTACDATRERPERVEFPPLTAHEVPERGFDVQHYAIDVELQPADRGIVASCRVDFASTTAGLDVLELELLGLEVSGVVDGAGRPLTFAHEGGRLAIDLAEPLAAGAAGSVEVSYRGRPRLGLWFSGDDGGGVPNQVFTQGQCDESRGWFPCFDHPSDRLTSEVRVTMPAAWISIAAGERLESSEADGRRTEHWRMDRSHACYLITLVAGDLHVVRESWEDVELWYAAEEQYADWMEASFHETDEALAFLSDFTGVRYPYSKYSQACVANFPWGGMENISATTLTPLTLDDERGNRDHQSLDLVVHEAAHQWFGDLITCNDWSHIWLNEGFATYCELLYIEASRGVDELRADVREYQEAYQEHDRGRNREPTVWNRYREPGDLFDEHVYEGAAVRLHALRFVLGDDAFRESVRAYVAAFADRNVETADFHRVVEETSGRELDWFFDQWFYRRGYPEFDVKWKWDEDDRVVELDVQQLQKADGGTPEVFRTPVAVEIRDRTGVAAHRIEVTRRRQRFELSAQAEPVYVRFDKGSWIPKGMRWNKSVAEWIAIAEQDDDVTGRRDAMRAIGRIAAMDRTRDPEKHDLCVATIVDRLRKDTSPWVRAAAAHALGEAQGLEARERLKEAASRDDEAPVRTASLEALSAWGENKDLARFARERFDDGYSWATMGAAAGLVCSADPDGAFDWIVGKLYLDSPHDQLREFLLNHLGQLDDGGVRDQLLRWSRDEAASPTARAVAVRRLAELPKKRIANAKAIGELLDCEPYRLRTAAVEALAALDNPESRRLLAAYYPRALDGVQRRAIEAALGGTGVDG